MDLNSPVIYGMEFQTRALAPHSAETDLVQFFVGTQGVRSENQVHFLDFDDENNSINKSIFMHPDGEIWSISTSNKEKNLISTVYNKVQNSKCDMLAAVWNVGGESPSSNDDLNSNQNLKLVSKFDSSGFGDVKNFLWYPTNEKSEVVILADDNLILGDLEASNSNIKIIGNTNLETKNQSKFSTGSWNPHHNCNQVATAHDSAITGWDLRTMKPIYSIDSAHSFFVRHVDFNPNKQYYLASCGDDCKVKFWDTRKVSLPVKTMEEHNHWVWQVCFNHFHDQLVLTSSSDGLVILSNLASISSEPFGHLIDDDEDDANEDVNDDKKRKKAMEDGRISTFEEHEDSVYSVAWSCADPWTFASLSYDGRFVVNRVPRSVKYQILL